MGAYREVMKKEMDHIKYDEEFDEEKMLLQEYIPKNGFASFDSVTNNLTYHERPPEAWRFISSVHGDFANINDLIAVQEHEVKTYAKFLETHYMYSHNPKTI